MFTLLNTRIYFCNAGHTAFKRTLSTSKLKEYYDALKVEKSSTPREIKDSFLRLSKIYHPDNKLTGSHTKFVELKEAYDAIKDGPPKVASTSSYQQASQEYDLSHRAYARYREQTRDYESSYGKQRYGFGGPYANSSNPWEELMRDKAYRKQQKKDFASRAGTPLASLTLILAAISWIVIYSGVLLIWDYNDKVKDSYAKNRTRQRDEYMSFENYMRRREEARRSGRIREHRPIENRYVRDRSPAPTYAIPETPSEQVTFSKEEPLPLKCDT